MKLDNKNSLISPAAKQILSLSPGIILLIIYLLSIAVRFSLAFLFRHGPTMQIDESLYINIAKSLAAGEGIAYRSQPIPYMYIFYPIVLAPLYLFPLPFDLYRVVQLYNAVLISTSIFPVYLFAKDFSGSRKKALLASALTLLMPDMQLAGFQMAESVVWPLSLCLIFFSCRLFLSDDKKILYGVLTGLLSALLFWTKPGAIAMGLVLLLSALFLPEDTEFRKRRHAALTGLIVCVSLIVSFYALYVFVFGYNFSLLGLYKKQLTQVSGSWFAAVAEFSLLQLILFAIACGGVCFVLPYACFRTYDASRKCFLSAFTVGLVVTAIGTAALVDMFLWNGSFTNPQLHLRYMAMYVPVMVVFSLAANLPNAKKLPLVVFLSVVAVLSVVPGGSVGFVKGESTYIDSLALSAWLSDFNVPYIAGIILSVLLVLYLIFLSFWALHRKLTPVVQKICFAFLTLFLLYNNICGYIACNSHPDLKNYGADAVEMNLLLESRPEEVLIITQQSYDNPFSYFLESRIRKPYQQVTLDALAESLSKTKGVYSPFIPEDQSPNVGNHSTPETDTFLFGAFVAEHVEFSPSVSLRKSQNENFTLAQVPDGNPLASTILHGLDANNLSEGNSAQLFVLDESRYKNGRLPFSLLAYARENAASLVIENAGKQQVITLSPRPNTYKISLLPGDTVLTAQNGDVVILTYQTG